MYVILVYDIHQKRVGKALKICRKYLIHIQKSVFEGNITESKLKAIVNNGMYFRVSSVRPVEKQDFNSVYCFEVANADEPYFTLPCGMITHNCRLRNELQDNTFSYTLGAGGVATGSKCVMTVNVNRLRKKLDAAGLPGFIATKFGVGYQVG